MLIPVSKASVDLQLNGRWVIDVEVLDDDLNDVSEDVTVAVTSTSPTNTVATPTVERLSSGVYRATVLVSSAGRYVAKAEASGYGVTSFTAYVSDITAANGMPTVQNIKDYSDGNLGSITDSQIQNSLNAESAQQRARLDIGAIYSADLAEALKRRVVRALNLKTKVMPADFSTGLLDGEGSAYVPFNDPEIRRLEAPYRKVVAF